MADNSRQPQNGADETDFANRRRVLKAVGAAGLAGLAGCTTTDGDGGDGDGDGGDGDGGDGDGGDGNGGDGDGDGDGGEMTGTTTTTPDIGTVNYGILNPLTGPFAALAEEQRRGAQLGVKWVNEIKSDRFDFTIDASYDDTEADTTTAQQAAQKLIQQDGAQFLMGAISSSVALALNEVAADQEVIYNPGGAAIPITGSQCNEYVFRAETNTAMIAEACAEWTLRNLSENVWFHIADYSYGQSVLGEWRSRMQESDAAFEEVGVTRAEVGADNFDPFISEMRNSDAEVAVIGSTGGDLVRFIKQAASAGLKEDLDIMTTTGSFRVVRGGIGADGYGVYSGTRYTPSIQTGDHDEFLQAFRDEYDGSDPDNFARVAFDSIRKTAQGIQEIASSDPTVVKDELGGMEVSSVFGPNEFRTCDHQAINPVWVGQNVEPDSSDVPAVDLIEKQEGQDAIPSCESTECDL